MPVLDPDIRARYEHAERVIEHYAAALGAYPALLEGPEPGYDDALRDMFDRIYFPNMRVHNGVYKLEAPREQVERDGVAVAALAPGDQYTLDHDMCKPSHGQERQIAQDLQGMEFTRRRTLARYLRDVCFDIGQGGELTQLTTTNALGAATITVRGDDTAGVIDPTTGAAVPMTYVGRPTMLFRLDVPVHTSGPAHEVEHAIFKSRVGALRAPDGYTVFGVIGEQRAYYRTKQVDDVLAANGVTETSQRFRSMVDDIDAVRSDALGPGPVFGYNREIHNAYVLRGMWHIMTGGAQAIPN